MPAKQINLLPHKDFDQGLLGRFLRWSLTYGRYIIISTEIIVLFAFIYRFSLDRTITDLNEEIEQKSAIVSANRGFEERFRNLQNRTTEISLLFTNQELMHTVLDHLQEITPAGLQFTDFQFQNSNVKFTVNTTTSNGLSIFLKNLGGSPLFKNINLVGLNKKNGADAITTVQIEVEIVPPVTQL